MLVAGEPGGGEPGFRARLEAGWGARVTEAMGIGDIGVSLFGECEAQDGMHLGAAEFVHPELIDPAIGRGGRAMDDGAEGELVLSHLRHRAAPLLRFRTRDHVRVRAGTCACGRDGIRIRCIGRTDDMLIVRGVNVFPSAIREVVGEFAPRVSGNIVVRPAAAGPKQEPPLPVTVELAEARSGRRGARGGDPRAPPRRAGGADRDRARAATAACSAASTSRAWCSSPPLEPADELAHAGAGERQPAAAARRRAAARAPRPGTGPTWAIMRGTSANS